MTVQRKVLLGLWSLILPVSLSMLLMFLVWTDSTATNTFLVAAAGALAGLIVGFVFGLRDWRLLIPPLATGLIGLGLYPLIKTVAWMAEPELRAYVLVWFGQAVALFVSTWLSSTRVATGPPEVDKSREPLESRVG